MYYGVGLILLMVVLAALSFVFKARYYENIFTPAHYEEIVRWAAEALKKHPVEEPSQEDGTALVTTGKIALAYTSMIHDGERVVHFSVSQGDRPTMQALGNRMVFLLIRLLHENKCQATLFQTPSTVHHAVFSMPESSEWKVADLQTTVNDMENYQRLPIPTRNVDGSL